MAQSRNFFGLRRGSTKTMTFQVLHGVQITKDRVYDVANPRTASQMGQRLGFANAVKFYSHGNQALFKFAFGDKKTNESEYNAFMRHNQKKSAVASRYMLDGNFPAVGNFVLTSGSLGTVTLESEVLANGAEFIYIPNVTYEYEEDTYGDFCKALLSEYPQLQDGDILTKVSIEAYGLRPAATLAEAKQNNSLIIQKEANANRNAIWTIKQDTIRTNDTTPLSSYNEDIFGFGEAPSTANGTSVAAFYMDRDQELQGVALIVSRPINNQNVLVTESAVIPDHRIRTAINLSYSEDWLQFVTDTYNLSTAGIEADAILKGEIVENNVSLEFTATTNPFTTSGATVANITKATNVDAEKLVVKASKDTSVKRLSFASYAEISDKEVAIYVSDDDKLEAHIPVSGNKVVPGAVKGECTSDMTGYTLTSID